VGRESGPVTVAVEQLGDGIDARPLMHAVRARLDALVAELDDADWRRATVCPGWDVADLVAHLVGDDLGRLSRTHDGAAGPPRRPGEDLPAYLDRINEEWVVAFRRLSPAVLVSLLGAGGGEVLALWDDAIDRDDLAGAVSWAGLEVGVGWMDHARDTTEYWIHEQHFREAVGRSHVDADEVAAVVDILARGLPHALEAVTAPEDAHVAVRADDLGLVWRIERRDDRWWFAGHRPATADEAVAPPFAAVTGTGDAYWRRWSRHPAGGRGAFSTSGDAAASAAVVDHVAVIRAPD
jgi:uncharacterized protein (TIGR03083 family)